MKLPLSLLCLTALTVVRPALADEPKPAAPAPKAEAPMIAQNDLTGWKIVSEMTDHGPVTVKDGVLSLGEGKPMTGVVYTGPKKLPVDDYEVTFEARRVDGADFFAALTFPVRDDKTFATFILGGWGGSLTGISCINFQSADENEASGTFNFENGKWYKIRLEVSSKRLVGHIDSHDCFDVSIEDKKISLRFGDIEYCKPFGFATYLTKGEIRNLQIKKAGEKSAEKK